MITDDQNHHHVEELGLSNLYLEDSMKHRFKAKYELVTTDKGQYAIESPVYQPYMFNLKLGEKTIELKNFLN